MTDEENFIVGKFKHNPLSDQNTPCIEILMDGASARGEGELLLLKQVEKEDRKGYTDKAMDKEKARKPICEQIQKCLDSLEEPVNETGEKSKRGVESLKEALKKKNLWVDEVEKDE